MIVPAIIADQGDATARRLLEFFTVNIRNKDPRNAYAQAVKQFLRWCEGCKLSLAQVEPMAVAAYIEAHTGSNPTRKQHLAAIKMLFEWMVAGQLMQVNPAAADLSDRICCHTFQATGTTTYLENDGTIEKAQQIAAHESPKNTKLYDHTNGQITTK